MSILVYSPTQPSVFYQQCYISATYRNSVISSHQICLMITIPFKSTFSGTDTCCELRYLNMTSFGVIPDIAVIVNQQSVDHIWPAKASF